MITDTIKLQILVINNDPIETNNIDAQLRNDMRVPWNLTSCETSDDAQIHAADADIIILKPETAGLTPKEVFQDVQDLVYETPIIVLTNAAKEGRSNGNESGFSTYLLENGAADTVIRGQFSRMVDAIEFAMIRQKISTAIRKDADYALAASEQQGTRADKKHNKSRVSEEDRHKQIVRMFLGGYSTDQAH